MSLNTNGSAFDDQHFKTKGSSGLLALHSVSPCYTDAQHASNAIGLMAAKLDSAPVFSRAKTSRPRSTSAVQECTLFSLLALTDKSALSKHLEETGNAASFAGGRPTKSVNSQRARVCRVTVYRMCSVLNTQVARVSTFSCSLHRRYFALVLTSPNGSIR